MKPWRVYLPGQLPSGKNAVIVTRSGKRFPGKRFKIWRDSVLPIINSAKLAFMPWDKPCSITITYGATDKRRRDVPGMIDALFHVLEKAEVVADDALFRSVLWVPVAEGQEGSWIEIDWGVYTTRPPWGVDEMARPWEKQGGC